MMKSKQLIYTVLCMILPSIVFGAKSLSTEQINKIDSRLRKVVAEQVVQFNKKTFGSTIETSGANDLGESVYDVIIHHTDEQAVIESGIPTQTAINQFMTARLTSEQIVRLAAIDEVSFIEASKLDYPMNDVAAGAIGADLLHSGYVEKTSYTGQNVLVCIIDTGIDWEHLDFRDISNPAQSRILYLWDQTITPTGGETSPSETGCNYGVEYTQAQINNEIDGSPAGFVREEDTNGHGTHVAGSAAGNGGTLASHKYAGIAPDAEIIFIKAGNGSFSHTNVINGLAYAKAKAIALGRPIVVNMSLGSNQGAHDGTDAKSQAIDDFIATGSGFAVVVSAGNDGDSDMHTNGTILNAGTATCNFTVPSYTAQASSDNDDFMFDIWFDGSGSISVTVTSPNSYTATQGPGGSLSQDTNDGTISIDNYIDSENGDRYLTVLISDVNASYPPLAGGWQVDITNNSGASVDYHLWLFESSIGSPSASVTLTGGDSEYTLGNTSSSAIIVGSCVSRWRWLGLDNVTYWGGSPDRSDNISAFSSHGPTRTLVQKPDIVAPGDKIASALSQFVPLPYDSVMTLPNKKYRVNQGTSMSSPVVAGAVALLFDVDPTLSSSEIKTLLTDNADTDTYTGSVWNNIWGYGRLNIFEAAVKALDSGASPDRETLAYDAWGTTSGVNIGANVKTALKFTPTISCQVTGFFVHTSSGVTITDPLYAEIWADNGSGLPDHQIGRTVSIDPTLFSNFTWHFMDLTDADASVYAGNHYHLVLYHASSGNNISWYLDTGTSNGRSSTNTGASWFSYSSNFKFRPVISSDEGDVPIFTDSETAAVSSTLNFNEGGTDPGDDRGVDITINSVTGSGDITVEQTNDFAANVPGLNAVDFKYDFSNDAGITAFNTDVVFHYRSSDVAGYTESSAYLGIGKYNPSTSTWTWLGGAVDAGANTITVNGVDSFSSFVLYRRLFGDVSGDGYVDAADLQKLGDCWHQTNSGEFTTGTDPRFFNYNKNTDGGNQIIDAGDLQVFGDCWHNGIAP